MNTLYSKTFCFNGITGQSAFPTAGPDWREIVWATGPWETVPIWIVGCSLDLLIVSAMDHSGGPCALAAFIGNSFSPDQMMPRRTAYSITEPVLPLRVDEWYPAGCAFPFPALAGDPNPLTGPHLDCHVFATPNGMSFVGEVNIFYVKAAAISI